MLRDINRVMGWSGPRVRSNRCMVSSARASTCSVSGDSGSERRRRRCQRDQGDLRARQKQGDEVIGPEHPAGAAQGVFPDDVGLFVLAQVDQRRGQRRGRGEGVEVVGTEDPLPPFVQFVGE